MNKCLKKCNISKAIQVEIQKLNSKETEHFLTWKKTSRSSF